MIHTQSNIYHAQNSRLSAIGGGWSLFGGEVLPTIPFSKHLMIKNYLQLLSPVNRFIAKNTLMSSFSADAIIGGISISIVTSGSCAIINKETAK